jgi:uncharacterized membrane protein (UPF0127 family)
MTLKGLLIVIGLAIAAPAFGQPSVSFPQSQLSIQSGDYLHHFTVEIATTPEQKGRGLMFRKVMDADKGMLFDYGELTDITMWMKNTYLPLDMIFIDGGGRIVHIQERTVPLSEALISSNGLARAVLELNGGVASKVGLKKGDRVIHEIFSAAP